MKKSLFIFIIVLSIAFIPKITLGQQANQGYHLAITPYAELYQKDSVKNKEQIKSKPIGEEKGTNSEKNKSIPLVRKCKQTLKKRD